MANFNDQNVRCRFTTSTSLTTIPTRSNCDKDIENAILYTATGFPVSRCMNPRISTYIPSAATLLLYLNHMDGIMAYNEEWTDCCFGWSPPISQIYISVLFYIQVSRAMDLACVSLGSDTSSLLTNVFRRYGNLYIPGPLVPYFKNLTCFRFTKQFGNITPALPNKPGWSADTNFCFDSKSLAHLPNISIFISRLHSIRKAATQPDVTQQSFQDDVDGPLKLSHLFGQPCNHTNYEEALLCSPGAKLAYAENLPLWQKSASFWGSTLPNDLDIGAKEGGVEDSWAAALRLNSETDWFGDVAAAMSRYCQFWKSSATLEDCHPDGSTSGAIRCSVVDGDLFDVPKWNNPTADRIGHYSMQQRPSVTFDASCVLPDVPEIHSHAAVTFQHHIIPKTVSIEDVCAGPFWDIRPIASRGADITVCNHIPITITNNYHLYEPYRQ